MPDAQDASGTISSHNQTLAHQFSSIYASTASTMADELDFVPPECVQPASWCVRGPENTGRPWSSRPAFSKRARAAAGLRTSPAHARWKQIQLGDVYPVIEFTRELMAAHLE